MTVQVWDIVVPGGLDNSLREAIISFGEQVATELFVVQCERGVEYALQVAQQFAATWTIPGEEG